MSVGECKSSSRSGLKLLFPSQLRLFLCEIFLMVHIIYMKTYSIKTVNCSKQRKKNAYSIGVLQLTCDT
jgi:hypothetical protein